MANTPLRILVVGGGITGMAAAYRLQKQFEKKNQSVEILLTESSPRLGGLIASHRRDEFLLEDGPDCFLTDKPRGMAFCQDIGLDQSVIETKPDARQALVFLKNKMHVIPKGFRLIAPTDLTAMLLSSTLSIRGKCSLLQDFLCPPSTVPDETIGAFVRRRFGQEVLERLAQPMVAAIYGADPDQMSLRATFPTLAAQDRKGSFFKDALKKKNPTAPAVHGARYALFGSFPNGMQTLVQKLGSLMTGVGARLQTSVRMLEGQESGWRAFLSTGEEVDVNGVCLAVPAPTAATIVMDMDPELYKLLMKVPSSDAISVYFALPESAIGCRLQGSGFVVPITEKRVLSACTFAHRKFENRAPKGQALLRAFISGKNATAFWNKSDEEIEKRLFTDLKEILKIRGEPQFAYLKRYRQALPHYIPGHEDRMATINEHLSALPGFVLAGNWNTGVGVPDCIEAGEKAADRLFSDLASS